jgi:GntR family transcriptional regulator, transcriptional repressor for pyruvate dehydrogenase complex
MKQFTAVNRRETLPEKIVSVIKETILSGEMVPGDALPAEPELEKQFQVSRAVIRDAMQMLKAQGLIEVKHGKGMFVSFTVLEAFSDALLTSLRRNNASAWDVEQFEQLLLPEVMVLAAKEADEQDIAALKQAAERYLTLFSQMTEADADTEAKTDTEEKADDSRVQEDARQAFHTFMKAIFSATHNKMIYLIGSVAIHLRPWRTIVDIDADTPQLLAMERSYIMNCVESISERNPQNIRRMAEDSLASNDQIIQILKQTPVGQSPRIPFLTCLTPDSSKKPS